MSFVLRVQSLGDGLRPIMSFFSFLGVETFYFLVMPVLLWCYDVAVGFRVGLILLSSATINGVLKLAFGLPRPFWISQEVKAYSIESSFGLPSGHAQNSVAVWGRLARAIGKYWSLIAAALLTLLISASRLYLGVHFPRDVLAGWLVGGILLALFLLLEEPLWKGFRFLTTTGQLAIAFVVSFGTLWLSLAVWSAAASRALPVLWIQNIIDAGSTAMFRDPRSPEGLFITTGTLLGLSVGGVLLHRWGRFRASGAWTQRTLRYLVGASGVAFLFFGLEGVGPAEGGSAYFWWTYLRYALIGFWIAYVAPRLFGALNLISDTSDPAANA